MAEKEMKEVVRSLNKAIEKKDVETVVSLYAEKAILIAPEGTFEGGEEIRRYWMWQGESVLTVKSTETEMIVQGNKLTAEHIIAVTMKNGAKWQVPIACMYAFADGKIKLHKMSYDRLSVAKQAVTGWLAKRLVNSIVIRIEKGLH
ncbi:MAG: nuclear transport factor 2 family protein [Candidatus Bathyarchaeia archaeon]